VLARSGRADEALGAYAAGLARSPTEEAALGGQADVLASLGRRAEAARSLDRLAALQEAGGRLVDACDTSRRALELAESKARRRQLDGLVRRLRAASPTDPGVEASLGAALRLLELSEPALQAGDEGAAGAFGERGSASAAAEVPPPPDPFELAARAEAAIDAGDPEAARGPLVGAALGHGAAGRPNAALDACYEALALAPADPDVHLALVGLYLDRGWTQMAAEKLALLGRLVTLQEDEGARARVCEIVAARFPDDPRLTAICP
jgi:tetratricopeptide (TPR) repeat protein